MPHLVEYPHEFCERHGMSVEINGRLLFIDAASCAIDVDDRREPPADPSACLRLRRTYHRARLAFLEKQFRELKAVLSGESRRGWNWDASRIGHEDPRDPVQALIVLRDLVMTDRSALAEVETAIGFLPEEIAAEAVRLENERIVRETQAARERQEQAQAVAITAIEI